MLVAYTVLVIADLSFRAMLAPVRRSQTRRTSPEGAAMIYRARHRHHRFDRVGEAMHDGADSRLRHISPFRGLKDQSKHCQASPGRETSSSS
jgi:hypothetical protein